MSVQTPLQADRQSLIPGLGCSVLIHGLVVGGWLLSSLVLSHCGPRKPILDLDKTMEVSMIAASELDLPERASRAPVPRGAPAPAPEPAPVEPPPVQSDLAYRTEEAEQVEGTDSTDELLEELERQRMLEELANAPVGRTNRQATDPDGTGEWTLNPGGASTSDPEYAAYIAKVQRIFQQHFKPLPAITEGRTDLVCTLFVQIDPSTGAITSWEIVRSSGIEAYDAAAERAVVGVGSIPLPPERFLPLVAQGYKVNLRP